jgi:hypothetical protein
MRKHSILKTVIGSCAVAVLAGCMSSGPKVTETREVNLPREENFPTPEEVASPGYKIAILPVEYNSSSVPASIASGAYDHIRNTLKTAGNDVIERDLASRMASELRAAAANGTHSSVGIEVADVVAIPEVTSLSWSTDYDEARRDDDGDYHPAECEYKGHTTLTVSLYTLPDMVPMGTHQVKGESKMTREERDSDCPLEPERVAGLWKASTKDAATEQFFPVLNQLAPNYYVMGRRDAENGDSIYKVNLGVTNGAYTGMRIDFYRRKVTSNPLTGKESVEDVMLGSGSVTEDIGGDYAYVVVDEEEVIQRIRLGTIARIYHDDCDRSGDINFCDMF